MMGSVLVYLLFAAVMDDCLVGGRIRFVRVNGEFYVRVCLILESACVHDSEL